MNVLTVSLILTRKFVMVRTEPCKSGDGRVRLDLFLPMPTEPRDVSSCIWRVVHATASLAKIRKVGIATGEMWPIILIDVTRLFGKSTVPQVALKFSETNHSLSALMP